MRAIHSFLSILLFFTISCKNTQYTYQNLPQKKIIFGTGGGISNLVKTYTLLENGQLFGHNSLTNEIEEYEAIERTNASRLFNQVTVIRFKDLVFNYPGNQYYFITYESKDAPHSVYWGDNAHKVPNEIKVLYKELQMHVK